MCIYTVKSKNLKKSSRGVRDSTECPKIGVSGVKDTAKTNKDWGMSCYIQVEYSVFSIGTSLHDHVKIIFKNYFIWKSGIFQ